MIIGADSVGLPILATRSRQRVGGNPHDLASEQPPLKLVFSNSERLGGAARLQSVVKSLSGTRTDDCDRNAGTVYERIKLSLLQRSWIPGELLQIGMFARELGTSTTPVREALVRLAAERLIAYTPKKGFLVKAITEEELRGLYLTNQMCLQAALYYSCESAGNLAERNSSGPTRSPVGQGGVDLAFITADLFLDIAASAGIDEIVAMICNINSRLHRPRIAEGAVIDDISYETSVMSDLFAAGKGEKLDEAIRRYHGVRLRMLSSICKELLSMSFAKL